MNTANNRPHVVIYATGGTIQCAKDAMTGKVSPAMTGAQMLRAVEGLNDRFEIEIREPFTMPGSDLSLKEALVLAQSIRTEQARPDVDGIVVLQGTDTMDEIPYFIHTTVQCKKPVVFTGSMKSARDRYSDALGNVYGAAMVAAHPRSRGRGVLIYFNETIFAAQELYKMHSSRIDAFHSFYGPLGGTIEDSVRYYRESEQGRVFEASQVDADVPIFPCYAGVDKELLEHILQRDIQALVIEGYGTGNIPRYLSPAVEGALDRGLPVVISTRCVDGESFACYDHPGGGAELERMGAILSGSLNAFKSRIKLIAMLACGLTTEEIREAFLTAEGVL